MRVLVVDDEALIVLLAAAWLEDLGCEVETAINGSEALAKLGNDQRIELLIADVNMPGISGYLVADRAKEMRPDLEPNTPARKIPNWFRGKCGLMILPMMGPPG